MKTNRITTVILWLIVFLMMGHYMPAPVLAQETTNLHVAASEGDHYKVRNLLNDGADVNALDIANQLGNRDVADLLQSSKAEK